MHKFSLPSKSVIYVMDAYGGWCWGFSQRMREFEATDLHCVAFAAISGGLFIGERAKSIASYPHIPEANERIAQMTGATFSDEYRALPPQGDMLMNSLDTAAGLAVLRAQAPERAVYWAHKMQAAFYGHSLSLSEHATIGGIAAANGLDEAAALRDIKSGTGDTLARSDIELTRQLGVSSYPTLLFVDSRNVHRLPATGTALSMLNQILDTLPN